MRKSVRLSRLMWQQNNGDSESGEMTKVVLEVGGKRCKFGAIEIVLLKSVFRSSVFEIVRGDKSHETQVPRVFRGEAPAYDSAEQPDS